MSKHIFAVVMLPQLDSMSVVYIFHMGIIFFFIYQLSFSPQQLLLVLFIALLQGGRQSPPWKLTVMYRKNHHISICSFPSITSRSIENLVSDWFKRKSCWHKNNYKKIEWVVRKKVNFRKVFLCFRFPCIGIGVQGFTPELVWRKTDFTPQSLQ